MLKQNSTSTWGQVAALLLLCAVLAAVAAVNRQSAGALDGAFRGIDGDSFRVGRTEVRLSGIDAPEGRQECDRDGRPWACGRESARQLERLVVGRPVSCTGNEEDRHGRRLVVCRVGEVEINRWMVQNGWAVAFGDYEAEERAASAARRGIWASRFERPREWRDRHKGP